MMFREIARVTINNFDNKVLIANKRATVPYYKEDKIPKKYLNPKLYGFDKKKRLFELTTGIVVPRNRLAGQPRFWNVNGNDIYNNYVRQESRANYMNRLKKYLVPYVIQFKGLQFTGKIKTAIQFIDVDLGKNNIDADNRWIWSKAYNDVLQDLNIIKNDNPYYVSNAGECDVTFTDSIEERKMILIIYEDLREDGNNRR